jgi:hypothetical protein
MGLLSVPSAWYIWPHPIPTRQKVVLVGSAAR